MLNSIDACQPQTAVPRLIAGNRVKPAFVGATAAAFKRHCTPALLHLRALYEQELVDDKYTAQFQRMIVEGRAEEAERRVLRDHPLGKVGHVSTGSKGRA